MARNLLEKAGRINLPPAKVADAQVVGPSSPTSTPPVVKAKTAPGTLMGFMANQSEAMKENERLREQAAVFEGASPTRRLDPKKIGPSRWANRDAASFESAEFESLKTEISQAGGNVQPIKVRPIARRDGLAAEGVGPSYPPGDVEFEIVFGHRRHRACLELGLPVLALIEAISDQELFVQMERENRHREDLSAWEQGLMYARALDQGLYPSNRQLASSIGRDLTDVGRALALARLPQAVIDAFRSPLDLQFRWAKPLNDLQQSDPELLLKRAKALKGQNLSGKATLEALIGTQGVGPSYPLPTTEVKLDGAVVATISTSPRGQVTVKFAGPLSEDRRSKLAKLIESFCK